MAWSTVKNDYNSIIKRHEDRITESKKVLKEIIQLSEIEPKTFEEAICKAYIMAGNQQKAISFVKKTHNTTPSGKKIEAKDIKETIALADITNNPFAEYSKKILDANSNNKNKKLAI